MAMNAETGTGRLACGAEALALCEDFDGDATRAGSNRRALVHDESCRECAGARASLRRVRTATAVLVEDPAEPPPGLLGSIMSAVRAEFRRGETLPLPRPSPSGAPGDEVDLGPATVAGAAAAAVARAAADTVPGIRARSCRIGTEGAPEGTVAVRMSVIVRYPHEESVERLLAAVRDRVRAALADRIGLTAAGIDVEVVDLWTEDLDG